VVNRRERIGDWEADLIVAQGRQGVALTLTERKSRFTLLRTFPSKHAGPITEGIIDLCQVISPQITDEDAKKAQRKKLCAFFCCCNLSFG